MMFKKKKKNHLEEEKEKVAYFVFLIFTNKSNQTYQ